MPSAVHTWLQLGQLVLLVRRRCGACAGTRLLVSCSNSRHDLLNAAQPAAQPLAAFSGHVNGFFYVRACSSGEGTHTLSGSSDHKALIWEVG